MSTLDFEQIPAGIFCANEPVPITELHAVRLLLGQYGTMKDIPLSELKAHGLKRIHDDERNIYSLITDNEYQRRYGRCVGLLKAYDGYIFAGHLDLMRRFFNCQYVITDDELNRINGRAQMFIKAGILPIFQQELYGRSTIHYWEFETSEKIPVKKVSTTFPSVDFILQFTTGAYDRRRAAIALRHRSVMGNQRGPIPIQPATVQDVFEFRAVAFTEESRISTILIREVAAYVSTHFKIGSQEILESVIENNRMAFLYLQDALKDLPFVAPPYLQWDGSTEVVNSWRWYLRYTPSDRTKIAKRYFDSLEKKPTGKERKTFLRMQATFPELCDRWRESVNTADRELISQLVEQAKQEKDFRSVPMRAFTEEPWKSDLEVSIGSFLQQSCERLGKEDPDKLFSCMARFHEYMFIPNFLPLMPIYKNIIEQMRLEIVKAYTDEQFVRVISSERYAAYMANYGHRRHGDRSPVQVALREAIEERHRSLKK